MSQSSSSFGNALDKELVQRAVLETAFAYYRKGPKIQYDSTELTTEDRESTGVCRLSSGDSPEMTGDDRSFYTVCSDWCYDVYYNAFGYQLTGSARRAFTYNMTPHPTSDPADVATYIYLGDGRVAACDRDGTRITTFDETVARAIPMNVVIGLRPSLAFDCI